MFLCRAAFSTDEEFVDHQKQFERHVFASHNEHKSHPFILKFKENCDHTCHSLLQSNFPGEKYSILDQQHGVLSVTPSELKQFHKNNQNVVEQFLPISPEVKIDGRIRTLHEDSCVGASTYREKNLRVVLSPLQSAELSEFKDYVVASQYVSAAEFDRQLDEQEADSKLNFILKVSDCSKAHRSAVLLAQRPEVVWIEENFDVYLHNRWARGVCEVGVGEVEPARDHNITGAGQIIGVSDTGIDMQHCYFRDDNVPTPYNNIDHNHRKVVQYVVTASSDEYDDSEGHGTHVAGTAAGYPIDEYGDYLKYVGTASGAKISFFDIGVNIIAEFERRLRIPNNINTGLLKVQYSSGARVFTNSWGTKGDNSYSTSARQVDQFMYENPDAVVFFSAGNEGSTADGSDNTVVSPATFKNGVTVGASLNSRDSWFAFTFGLAESVYDVTSVAGFSSRGPTADQRLKPDILAPGWFVASARGGFNTTEKRCDLAVLRGTSMASPAAAGTAVLVRQYFLDGYYPSGRVNPADSFNPSGALLKAMLVHSGQKMNYHVESSGTGREVGVPLSSYPSTVQGYGRIQLNKVLNFAQSTTDPITLFVLGAANSSQPNYVELTNSDNAHSYTFVTSATTAAVRVTLAYTDYFGSSGTSSLINTIMVTVTDESTDTTFSPYRVSNFVVTNLQVIDIATPTAGATYRVDVSVSGSLVTASQPYALVVSGTLTYLDAKPDVAYKSEASSASYVSAGARNYIIAFSFLVAILMGIVYYFRMLTKKKSSIVLDPRNFENLDGDYELDVPDTGMGGRKSILATIRDIRRQSLMKRQETGGTH